MNDNDNEEVKVEENKAQTDAKDTTETVEIVKESFVDKEGMEQAAVESVGLEEAVPVQIFMEDNEKVLIEIDILSDKKTGKIISVFKKDSFPLAEMKDLFGHCVESFEFSVPTFENVSLYRQRSSNNNNRNVDKNMFRNFLIAMHLKDWSLKGKDGKKINLDFDIDDVLTKESIRVVNKVPTVIWDVVLTAFERETLIC